MLADGGTYLFTPIDDRDFVLELRTTAGAIEMRVDAVDQPFSEQVGWPNWLAVESSAVEAFATGLMLEFDVIRRRARS